MNNKKICVVGIGGVGGLLAGLLLRRYGESVSLLARGARVANLQTQGLCLRSDAYGSFTAPVSHVSEDPAALGVQDIVFVCVKNNDLEATAAQIRPLVGDHTWLMPVMNGVTAGEVLARAFPRALVLESVIYTVSSIAPDGSILQQGDFTALHLGDVTGTAQGAAAAAECFRLLADTGLNCHLADDVRAAIWKKYIFNCAYNVITARYGVLIGEVKASPQLCADYLALMQEALSLAQGLGMVFPADLLERNMETFLGCTDDSDSSLGRDFRRGRKGELEVFCGEVTRLGRKLGIPTPVSDRYYAGLLERAANFS